MRHIEITKNDMQITSSSSMFSSVPTIYNKLTVTTIAEIKYSFLLNMAQVSEASGGSFFNKRKTCKRERMATEAIMSVLHIEPNHVSRELGLVNISRLW